MKLSEVTITNFRSIKEAVIEFNPRCRVLAGMNEAGKSNVLRALSLLSASETILRDDIRQSLPSEEEVKDAWGDFNFSIEQAEMEILCGAAEQKVYSLDQEYPILKKGKDSLTPSKFFRSRSRSLYRVNILKQTRFASYWTLSDEYKLVSGWKVPTESCPANGMIPGTQTPFRNFGLIHLEDYTAVPSNWLRDAEVEDANDIVGELLKAHTLKNLPEVIYWTYHEKYLLPPQINLDQFQNNPAACIPLMHMFGLADISNITTTLADARQNPQRRPNLLNKGAERATKHLNEVWKETRGVEISLAPNGPNIDASIKDKENLYGFAMRSDGFKRFLTFLLMISSRVKTNQLKGALLIIDEPENGLHPTGARFLMDELIKISQTNYVLYCTHSIFMVDRDMIGRHMITTKNREISALNTAGPSNFQDEEVIYQALGYSTFDALRKMNFIFEGWRDKRLFKIAIAKAPKHVREVLSPLGCTHAEGVSDVRKLTQMLELASRECIVISDSDGAARKAQAEFAEKYGYGTWLTYKDIDDTSSALTGEDYVKPQAFQEALDAVRQKNTTLPEIKAEDIDCSNGRMAGIKKWLKPLPPEEFQAAIRFIKTKVYAELAASEIEPAYFDLLSNLATKISAVLERIS